MADQIARRPLLAHGRHGLLRCTCLLLTQSGQSSIRWARRNRSDFSVVYHIEACALAGSQKVADKFR